MSAGLGRLLAWAQGQMARPAPGCAHAPGRSAGAGLHRLGWLGLLMLAACAAPAPSGHMTGDGTGDGTGDASALFVPLPNDPAAATSAEPVRLAPVGQARPHLIRQRRARVIPPEQVQVWLYASLASQQQISRLGADPGSALRMWEIYLRGQKIVYQRLREAAQIDQAPAHGVLLLPSAVVLSAQEQRAVQNWRNRGGSVLASWLTAAYDDQGAYVGDAFMRQVLDVRVAGDTARDREDVFMVVQGAGALTHRLPSGQRVWLERVPHLLPLRLLGQATAAHIQDWSRNVDANKPTGLITFGERLMPSGLRSRSVHLGYPEQNWVRSDPKQLQAISADALDWLLRRPSAYAAPWPAPAQAALLLAVQAAEPLADAELEFGQAYRQSGGRATYFVQSSNVAQALAALKPLLALGHELAYYCDSFESFAGQSAQEQAQRLDNAQAQLRSAGLTLPDPPGFAAPMDGYDDTTRRLLRERGFGHYLSFMETSDTSLPFIERGTGGLAQGTVVLPRTLIGPEEALAEWGDAAGMAHFLAAQDLAIDLGGLSVVRLPSSALLSAEQLQQITAAWARQRARLWPASARELADWWRVRAGVQVQLEADLAGPRLQVDLAQDLPAGQALRLWVNLPQAGTQLSWQALEGAAAHLQHAGQDDWRVALDLSGARAGRYRWRLDFDGPNPH